MRGEDERNDARKRERKRIMNSLGRVDILDIN